MSQKNIECLQNWRKSPKAIEPKETRIGNAKDRQRAYYTLHKENINNNQK